jgi:O-antigen biosynthesis protein WbqP
VNSEPKVVGYYRHVLLGRVTRCIRQTRRLSFHDFSSIQGTLKRVSDVFLVVLFAPFITILVVLVASLVKLTSRGPVLYWSQRVGRGNKLFDMPKFRTMKVGTSSVATHLLKDPQGHLTLVGGLLRRSSLDELPQLWSVLRGEMSLVGPRPALFNQLDLQILRNQHRLQRLVPGLTGWAQINGRDRLSIQEKVKFDVEYRDRQSLMFDVKIILVSVWIVITRRDISH